MKARCPTCGQTYGSSLGTFGTSPEAGRDRILRWMVRKLWNLPEGLTNRELTKAVSSRDRGFLHLAKTYALEQGIVRINENKRFIVDRPR